MKYPAVVDEGSPARRVPRGRRSIAGEHALVLGASMAGLLAARVLSERYRRVTLLERDALPATPEIRQGVPQGAHAHALLGGGLAVLEGLFPGLAAELVEQGAPRGHGRHFSGGGYLSRNERAPRGLFVSRPCLELAVRRRIACTPNVRIVEGREAVGLLASDDRSRVTGVRAVRRRPARAGRSTDTGSDGTAVNEVMTADLVVDATGRGSRSAAWLEALGYEGPEVERLDVGMGYGTRVYRRRPEHLGGDPMMLVAASPENRRACALLAQEGDRWIVTLAGYFGDHPPTDEVGFLEFARALPAPEVYEVLRTAEPLSEPIAYRFRGNERRRYERLARLPEGYVVVGDALCSFTPIYGQGMTVAAFEALVLRRCLDAGPRRLGRRFFHRASDALDNAWTISVGNDLRLSGTAPATLASRCLHGYIDRLLVAARHDRRLALAFHRVCNLLDGPASLLRPDLALRVLWGNLERSRAARSTASPSRQEPRSVSVAG